MEWTWVLWIMQRVHLELVRKSVPYCDNIAVVGHDDALDEETTRSQIFTALPNA